MSDFKRAMRKAGQYSTDEQRQRAELIDQFLHQGSGHCPLNGRKIACAPELIRFKLGRYWRLLYRKSGSRLTFEALVPRKQLEQYLKHSYQRERR